MDQESGSGIKHLPSLVDFSEHLILRITFADSTHDISLVTLSTHLSHIHTYSQFRAMR